MDVLIIKSKQAMGHYRAGRHWSYEGTVIEVGVLNEAELKLVKSDPLLTVTEGKAEATDDVGEESKVEVIVNDEQSSGGDASQADAEAKAKAEAAAAAKEVVAANAKTSAAKAKAK